MDKDNIHIVAIVAAVALIGITFILLYDGTFATAGNPANSIIGDVVGGAFSAENLSSGYFCSDNDGSNYSVKGLVYGYPINSNENYNGNENYYYEDTCLCDGKTLVEYTCQNNNVHSETYLCPNGCVDGRCV